MPAEIDGVQLVDALHRIRRVLLLEGSAALKESLDSHGDWLIALFERATDSKEALRILLGEEEDGVGAAPACLRIFNAKGIPGTVSALVRCDDGLLKCLTNYHVLFGNGGKVGDTVFALDESNGGSRLIAIGTALRGHIGRVMDGGSPVFVDCALATLGAPRVGRHR